MGNCWGWPSTTRVVLDETVFARVPLPSLQNRLVVLQDPLQRALRGKGAGFSESLVKCITYVTHEPVR